MSEKLDAFKIKCEKAGDSQLIEALIIHTREGRSKTTDIYEYYEAGMIIKRELMKRMKGKNDIMRL